MPTKPVRFARSTSVGGMNTRGMDGAGENVCSLNNRNRISKIGSQVILTLYPVFVEHSFYVRVHVVVEFFDRFEN